MYAVASTALVCWLVCGAIAAVWWMALISLNISRAADYLGYRLRAFNRREKIIFLILMLLALFITGPFGLADVMRAEIKKRRMK